MNGRWPTEKIYVPESQSIVETVHNLQKKGKMKLTFKGQTEAEALSKKMALLNFEWVKRHVG